MMFEEALAKVADLLKDESVRLLTEQAVDESGIELDLLKELISVKYFASSRESFNKYKEVFESTSSKSTSAIIYNSRKAEIKELLTEPFISQIKNSLKT